MPAAPEVNPTVARRELAVYFHRLRKQRGVSLDELGRLLGVRQSQASRLDTGARGLRTEDVDRLCHTYGIAAGERGRLLALATEAQRRAWWQRVSLPPDLDSYRTLIGFEQAAESIKEFGSLALPGLLQTERYAVATTQLFDLDPAVARQAVEIRMRRQAILDRQRPPEVSIVIDEVVLARGAGGPGVMREQLQRLLDFTERPRSTIQVVGFEAGMYPASPLQFILLDMGSRLPPLYYSEDLLSATDSSDEDDVRRARTRLAVLQAKALTPKASAQRIARYRDAA